VLQLASTQHFDGAFLVLISSRCASKRSTPVSHQQASMQTVDINTPVNHDSDPAVLAPIGRSGSSAVNGINIPRSNSTSHL
jgi:hypothetical protein